MRLGKKSKGRKGEENKKGARNVPVFIIDNVRWRVKALVKVWIARAGETGGVQGNFRLIRSLV